MASDFTAVYMPQDDGTVYAYVAELPGVKIRAATRDEARDKLTERLRRALQRRRKQGLSWARPDAVAETIQVDLGPPEQPGPGVVDQAAWVKAQTEYWEAVLAGRKVKGLPPPPPPGLEREEHDPIPIKGRPISEELIEDRR